MLVKLKDALDALFKKASPQFLSTVSMSMGIVFAVALTYALIVILFIAGWVHNWRTTGMADLPILLSLFDRVASSGAVLAFTWIGKAFVDKNKNNIPDSFESEENQNNSFMLSQKRNEGINNVNQNISKN